MKSKNVPLKVPMSSLALSLMLSLAGCGGSNEGGNIGSTTSGGSGAMLSATTTLADASVDSSQFLVQAYQDGLGEIQLSQQALQKSANPDVTKFAQRMIDDHTGIDSEITQLAQSRNIALPTDLSADQKTLANNLSSLSGDAFDSAYMAANVSAHMSDVSAARQQAQQGSDPDVMTLANGVLPILQVHLAAAEELNGLLDPSAFLSGTYQAGLAEIGLSQLALQKSSNAEVKQFAQRMIDDHTQGNNQIAGVAQSKSVSLPSSPTAEQQAVLDELSGLSGADFDKAYMDQNVIAHVKVVRQTRQQSQQGKDADVKNLAQTLLPVLASHLASAVDIDGRIQPSFLFSAFQDGTAEIQMARLALLQASSDQVKAFAQQMITDHTTLNAQVRQVAQQMNIALPTEMSAEQWSEFVNLMGKSGAAFDQEYMSVNVQEHQKDVGLAAQQAQDASDAAIRTLAQNALPVLNMHLTNATQLLQQLGGAQM